MSTQVQTTVFLERDDQEIELTLVGTYVQGEQEVRWPNDRAHPGSDPKIVDVRAFLPSGEEFEFTFDEINGGTFDRLAEDLWDQVEAENENDEN